MHKYEYKFYHSPTGWPIPGTPVGSSCHDLNRLGKEGWELCGQITHHGDTTFLIFKRMIVTTFQPSDS